MSQDLSQNSQQAFQKGNADPSLIDHASLMSICQDENVIYEIAAAVLQEAPTTLGHLVSAVQTQDMAKLRSYAHKLKGGTATLGALTTSELARQLEQAARENDTATIRQTIDQFEQQMNDLLSLISQPSWLDVVRSRS